MHIRSYHTLLYDDVLYQVATLKQWMKSIYIYMALRRYNGMSMDTLIRNIMGEIHQLRS